MQQLKINIIKAFKSKRMDSYESVVIANYSAAKCSLKIRVVIHILCFHCFTKYSCNSCHNLTFFNIIHKAQKCVFLKNTP